MKAFFITTRTGDCSNHVRAWESFAKAEVIFHTPTGIPNDIEIVKRAVACQPDVIFYIGAHKGPGCTIVETFHTLRKIAPTINICSDAVDEGWHDTLRLFRQSGCFDLHVAIDGAENQYIDLSTVTPIDPIIFGEPVAKDIFCGFSGNFGSRYSFDYKNHDSAYRGKAIYQLQKKSNLIVRQRTAAGAYSDHVDFMKRCKIVLNVSLCGSATAHQIKGRAIEAGWAGCALLESVGSPAINRFPKGSVIPFATIKQAKEILRDISEDEIKESARLLYNHVRSVYRPEQIYGGMLNRVGITLPR
mgnify:FL=1